MFARVMSRGGKRGRIVAIWTVCLLATTPQARGQTAEESQAYDSCMALVTTAAEQAYDSARRWQREGGGQAAGHCAASALMALGHNREAALALEQLAQEVTALQPALAAGLLAQAGRARLAAGQLERAQAVQTTALALAPGNIELLIDRSITLATAGDYPGAIADLDQAAAQAPGRAEILVLRATALRMLDKRGQALADIARALLLEPENAEGLLERGVLRRLEGDAAAARDDWVSVLRLAPDGPAAAAARANLEKLDVTIE